MTFIKNLKDMLSDVLIKNLKKKIVQQAKPNVKRRKK